MIIKLFVILSIISYLLSNKINKDYGNNWMIFNYCIFAIFYIGFCIIKYSNYVNFIIYTIFSSIFMVSFIIYFFKFSKQMQENLLIWILLILSIITAVGMLKVLYTTSELNDSEALIGEKGPIGRIGERGAILDSNEDYCYNQLIFQVEKTLSKWKDDNNILYDKKLNYFNNIYFKNRLKRICKSQKYYSEVSNNTHYKIIKILTTKVNSWVLIILKYTNGSKFLEEYFWTDYHWKHNLLSKNKTRKEFKSPINVISADPIWNW